MAIPVGGTHDITLYEGAGFREEFEMFEDDETTPINFAAASVGKAQMRTSENRSSNLLGDFVVEIEDNKLSISLSSESAIFNVAQGVSMIGYYDIFVTEPDQEPIMFMEGKARINPAVTAPDIPPDVDP